MTAPQALFSSDRSDAAAADDHRLADTCLGAAAQRGMVLSFDAMSTPDAVFRWPGEVATGPGAAMANALSDLAAFPDAAMVVEDVLATPTPHEAADPGAGTYHSARGVLLGRHDGPGFCGAPSGRRVEMRRMADYWAFGGRLHDVWIVSDTAGLLAQTGAGSPREHAAGQLAAAAGAEVAPAPLTPDTDIEGPFAGRGERTGAAGDLAGHLKRIMDGQLGAAMEDLDPACNLTLPAAVRTVGHTAATGFWAGLRSALPSASFRIEHVHGAAGGPHGPARAALRWSLYGRHDGPGRFGAPTGAYVYMFGLTQAEFGANGLRRMWTLIDDLAIWTQILAATGEA